MSELRKLDEHEQKLSAETVAKLREIAAMLDYEVAHQMADTALCDLLTALGYAEVVAEWDKVSKWYA